MKEPTMEEVLELVDFERDASGNLLVKTVKVSVWGTVKGSVYGNVGGYVEGSVGSFVGGGVGAYIKGNVGGNVWGDVKGIVCGTINGRKWQFVETPKEKAIRLILEGETQEAIKVLKSE